MSKVVVIGVGSQGVGSVQAQRLRSCGLLVGSDRLLAPAAGLCPATRSISPLAEGLATIREGLKSGDVGVLAGGDPLFFGIGRRLLAEFGPHQVEIHPALSAMQEAMARFRLPWDDARLLSLHGRKEGHVAGLLLAQPKTVVLTDKQNSPDRLARRLGDYLRMIEARELLTGCRVLVAENLGGEAERLFDGTLEEAADRGFADLNLLCLLAPREKREEQFGLTEGEIVHSRGLITKDEVRAVSLHALRLPGCGVFWDVGAGSGAMAVEAARLHPDLTIFAVEQRQEELTNIKANIRRHGCYNVVPVAGAAPDVLAALPEPERVFIGGHGGRLADIIAEAARRLPPAGRLVVNGVTRKTVAAAPRLMTAAGLTLRVSAMEVTRSEQAREPVIFNQIHVMTGSK